MEGLIPVSYTHLDVYKRQQPLLPLWRLKGDDKLEIYIMGFGNVQQCGSYEMWGVPDVYKRQEL